MTSTTPFDSIINNNRLTHARAVLEKYRAILEPIVLNPSVSFQLALVGTVAIGYAVGDVKDEVLEDVLEETSIQLGGTIPAWRAWVEYQAALFDGFLSSEGAQGSTQQ